jgi:thioredoxin 1
MGFEAPTDVASFQQAVVAHGDKPVFLKFSADFCAPCASIAGDLDKLAEEFGDRMGFVYVDVEALSEVQELYEVANLPTFIVLKNF